MKSAFNLTFTSIPDCVKCFDSVLPAEENTIDGRTIHSFTKDLPSEKNLTNYEIELLLNRHKQKSFENNMAKHGDKPYLTNLTDTCKSCEALLTSHDDELGIGFGKRVFNYLFTRSIRWYEGLGYYGTIPGRDNAKIKPKNELKAMMEAQTTYFGLNQNYTGFVAGAEFIFKYNEIEVDANLLNNLEFSRASLSLGFDGIDESSSKCGGSIKALVLICGDQKDPFYYGERGTCLDKDRLASIYKEVFEKDDAPQVVYFNLKNLTHPFSSTCDKTPSCGVTSVNGAVDNDNDDTQPDSGLDSIATPFKVLARLMGVLTMMYL